MHIFIRLFQIVQLRVRRWQFKEGKIISRFIARDVRRDVLVISSARISEGIIVGRTHTMNVLYNSKGLTDEPAFNDPQEINLGNIWRWTGQSWGGLPDGTSIVDTK